MAQPRADEHGGGSPAARWFGRHRRRLVLGSAGVQERPLGQGDDVDLPPQRYVHLQLVSDLVHDGANIHYRPLAQPSEVFALTIGGKRHSADPDRDHDLHPDQQQRDDGPSRQLRLSKRSRQNICLLAAHRGIGRHVRRDAGLRMDQADHGRGNTSLGQPAGRGRSSARAFS